MCVCVCVCVCVRVRVRVRVGVGVCVREEFSQGMLSLRPRQGLIGPCEASRLLGNQVICMELEQFYPFG